MWQASARSRAQYLRLAVWPHDVLVAADALVVLGGDRPRVVERGLAGEHHRALRRHHQDAARVHQHRGLGVPIGLAADGDPDHQDVDLIPRLRELDQAPQHLRDPVHVLGAALHGDLRPRRQGEPLDRHPHFLRKIQRGEDAGAFRLRERAHFLARVAENDHPRHPFGVLVGVVGDDADDHVGGVAAVRPVHRDQARALVEVVLDEHPGRQVGLRLTGRREHPDQLVRIGQPPLAHPHDFLRVLGDRPNDLGGRLVELKRHAVAGRERHAHDRVAKLPGLVRDAGAEDNLLQAQPLGLGAEPPRDRLELFALQVERRPDVQQDAVPLEAIAGRPAQLHAANGRQRFHQHPVEMGDLHQPAPPIPDRGDVPHLGDREQPLVLRVVACDPVEEIDILDRRQAVDEEVSQPPQLQPLGHHRVQAAIQLLLPEAPRPGPEGVALRAARRRHHVLTGDHHHDAADRTVEAHLVEHGAQFVGRCFRVLERAPRPDVEIDHDVLVTRHGKDHPLHGFECPPHIVLSGMSRHEPDVPALDRRTRSSRRCAHRFRPR